MERPREQRLPRSSEREPCEIRPSSSESHVTPASCASRCGSPNADRLHPGQPQDPHPSLRPRVLQIHTLGSHLAHLTPTLSSVASTDDERRPVANTDTLAAPRAGCSTSVTAQLNARTSFEAAHSAAHPLSANEAGSSLATVAFTPEPPTNGSASVSYRPWETTTVVANLDGPAPVDCRDSLKHHAHATKPPRQPEISLSNTAIDSRSPSPPHSIIDLTTSPEPNRGPSSSPIAPDSSLSPGSSCLTLPNFPPIFIIGSHQLQFHVLPSSGRPWVEQAITVRPSVPQTSLTQVGRRRNCRPPMGGVCGLSARHPHPRCVGLRGRAKPRCAAGPPSVGVREHGDREDARPLCVRGQLRLGHYSVFGRFGSCEYCIYSK